MKKLLFSALMLILLSPLCLAKNLKAYFSYCTFNHPQEGPYVETYLMVVGNSVEFVKTSTGSFSGTIEVTLIFSDKGKIIKFDKYNLLSPEVASKDDVMFNFVDQQRLALVNGNYTLEVIISDKNSTVAPFTASQEVTVEYHPNIISVSDIELIDSMKKTDKAGHLTKSGFDLIPYVTNFYPQAVSSLTFYAEIYNTDRVLGADNFMTSYYISSYESKRILEKFRSFKRHEPKDVVPLINEFPITELPSGNYILTVEVRSKTNDLLALREIFFQRSNQLSVVADNDDLSLININNTFVLPYNKREVLVDMIASVRPVSNIYETAFADNQLKIADISLMQKFFYNFWQKRNPLSPESEWMKYRTEVEKVNESFSTTIQKGYETDRGRVYLQYGPPNTIATNTTEPSAYPYEIWHYYKLGNQSNRKFVFYNPDLVSNDFVLIHSDALGEITDSRWQMKINKRQVQNRDLDVEKSPDQFGGKSEDFFKMPR